MFVNSSVFRLAEIEAVLGPSFIPGRDIGARLGNRGNRKRTSSMWAHKLDVDAHLEPNWHAEAVSDSLEALGFAFPDRLARFADNGSDVHVLLVQEIDPSDDGTKGFLLSRAALAWLVRAGALLTMELDVIEELQLQYGVDGSCGEGASALRYESCDAQGTEITDLGVRRPGGRSGMIRATLCVDSSVLQLAEIEALLGSSSDPGRGTGGRHDAQGGHGTTTSQWRFPLELDRYLAPDWPGDEVGGAVSDALEELGLDFAGRLAGVAGHRSDVCLLIANDLDPSDTLTKRFLLSPDALVWLVRAGAMMRMELHVVEAHEQRYEAAEGHCGGPNCSA